MISTHILDTSLGRPAANVPVVLERVDVYEGDELITRATTDEDGRVKELAPRDRRFVAGTYRLTFDTGSYFAMQTVEGFYPSVAVLFTVRDPASHHHVPLLISPFGYSTYRGS